MLFQTFNPNFSVQVHRIKIIGFCDINREIKIIETICSVNLVSIILVLLKLSNHKPGIIVSRLFTFLNAVVAVGGSSACFLISDKLWRLKQIDK